MRSTTCWTRGGGCRRPPSPPAVRKAPRRSRWRARCSPARPCRWACGKCGSRRRTTGACTTRSANPGSTRRRRASRSRKASRWIASYLDAAGDPVIRATVGDVLTVRLRVRSTRGPVHNVAVTDLLPGGFEILADSVRGEYGATRIEHRDVREDRLVLYGSFDTTATEIRYHVKAVAPRRVHRPRRPRRGDVPPRREGPFGGRALHRGRRLTHPVAKPARRAAWALGGAGAALLLVWAFLPKPDLYGDTSFSSLVTDRHGRPLRPPARGGRPLPPVHPPRRRRGRAAGRDACSTRIAISSRTPASRRRHWRGRPGRPTCGGHGRSEAPPSPCSLRGCGSGCTPVRRSASSCK